METIVQVFEKFLADQKARLKKPTLNKYVGVMDLLERYMNNYAHNFLEEDEGKLFWNKYKNEKKEFCEIFGIDKLTESEISEFLSYFMIRKVTASKELMKNTVRVLRKFIKWLKDNSYIDKDESFYKAVNEYKDNLPKVVELSGLFAEEAIKNDFRQYEVYESGYFTITKIEEDKLWVEDFMGSDTKIGPIIVPKEISLLAKEGWTAYLELGRKNKRWYVTGSGKVYPH